MRGKSSTNCRLRRLTSQKRAYLAQKGVHRSAVLVLLGNKSLVRDCVANWGFGKFHALKLIVIARVESAVMLEHEAFKLSDSNWYWLARLCLSKPVAFCHNDFVSFEVRRKGDIINFGVFSPNILGTFLL